MTSENDRKKNLSSRGKTKVDPYPDGTRRMAQNTGKFIRFVWKPSGRERAYEDILKGGAWVAWRCTGTEKGEAKRN